MLSPVQTEHGVERGILKLPIGVSLHSRDVPGHGVHGSTFHRGHKRIELHELGRDDRKANSGMLLKCFPAVHTSSRDLVSALDAHVHREVRM